LNAPRAASWTLGVQIMEQIAAEKRSECRATHRLAAREPFVP
jgi:hypothetical protein